MIVDVIVGSTCLGENELEKTSDRYDTLWALVCWCVLDDFDLMPEMIADSCCKYTIIV